MAYRGFTEEPNGEWWAFQDPDDDLDYAIDWADPDRDWLQGDTIVTSTWEVPDGLTSHDESHTDTTATIWLKGALVGQSYIVTNHIVTAAGRKADQSFTLRGKQR